MIDTEDIFDLIKKEEVNSLASPTELVHHRLTTVIILLFL